MEDTLIYTKHGDYLIPNIILSEPADVKPIGRYAKMRRAYLKEHRPIIYSKLILTEQLFPHLREVDESAATWFEQMMVFMIEKNKLPDKASNPMVWTAAMNALKQQAEEVIIQELIYS